MATKAKPKPKVWKGPPALRRLLVPLEMLEPFPGNPRRGDVEQLQRSLRRFGQVLPVLTDPTLGDDGKQRIVARHHLVLAAAAEGWTHVAVIENAFEDEEEARAYLLADNKLGALGGFDQELLAAQLSELRSYEGTGYSAADRAALDRQLALLRGGPDADDAPEPPADPSSVVGELYELGRHRLVCGDARDPEVIALAVGDAPAGMLLTDPPYGVGYEGTLRDHIEGTQRAKIIDDDLGDDGVRALVGKALAAALPVLRPGASFYLCAPPGPSELQFRLALADAGLRHRQTIVWVKDQFVLGRGDYHGRHESLLYGWVSGAGHTFVGGKAQDTVWEFPRPRRSPLHPTMKPVDLFLRAVRNSSVIGDVVLDPFAGSGTTLIACEDADRVAALVELDPAYCDVIRERYRLFVEARASLGIAAA
jgi:DNA modification methylase